MATDLEFIDPDVVVVQDLKPKAPVHLLILPKRHIATIDDVADQDQHLLGHMIIVAKLMAQKQHLHNAGYRLVFNVNAHGGQAVYHIHLHLLGGRRMLWPPG